MASAPCVTVECHQLRHVEVGEDVAVDHDERVVDARRIGGETNGAGRVERLGLDGVAQGDAGAPPSGNAATNGSGLKPSASVTSVMPLRPRLVTSRSMMGTWPTGSIGLGIDEVSGRRRVPNPPTSTTARISRRSWWSPRQRWWWQRRPWCRWYVVSVVATVVVGGRVASADDTQLGQLGGRVGLGNLGVAGHDSDGEHHAVVVEAQVAEVGDVVEELAAWCSRSTPEP